MIQLRKYSIKPKTVVLGAEMETETIITAKTAKSAWGKFCAQYFGVLKPARKDYTCKTVGHVTY